MEFFVFVCLVVLFVCLVNKNQEKKAEERRVKEQKEIELLKENPDAYATQKLVEQERKQRQFEAGAHIGMEIARRLMK